MSYHVIHTLRLSHRRLAKSANQIAVLLAQWQTTSDHDHLRLHRQVSLLRDDYLQFHEPLVRSLVTRLTQSFSLASQLFETTVTAHGRAFCESLNHLQLRLDGICVGQVVSREEILRQGEETLHHLRAQLDFESHALLPWARERLGLADWAAIELAMGHQRVGGSQAGLAA